MIHNLLFISLVAAITKAPNGYYLFTDKRGNVVMSGAGWIILDVLTGLVGVIVDAATEAWYFLDQKFLITKVRGKI